MNLSSTIKSIQDIMRKDDGVDGDAQRIGQLTWMLFLKIYDQKEDEWEKHDPDFWQNNRKADVFTYDQGKTWHDNAGNTGSCLNDK